MAGIVKQPSRKRRAVICTAVSGKVIYTKDRKPTCNLSVSTQRMIKGMYVRGKNEYVSGFVIAG